MNKVQETSFLFVAAPLYAAQRYSSQDPGEWSTDEKEAG